MTTQLPIPKEQLQKIIETADEIITVNDGTNEDISKNDTNKIIALYDHLNDDLAPPAVVKELARALLAAYEQEPVAFIAYYESGAIHGVCQSDDTVKMEWLKRGFNVLPLYTHPAPSIPAVPVGDRADFETFVRSIPNGCNELAVDAAGFYKNSKVHYMFAAWNACRAAMLNGGKS